MPNFTDKNSDALCNRVLQIHAAPHCLEMTIKNESNILLKNLTCSFHQSNLWKMFKWMFYVIGNDFQPLFLQIV